MSVLDAFKLIGKVAIVTGGNRGLGEAFVKALADVGATVVIATPAGSHDRSELVAAGLHAEGKQAIIVDVDVSQPDQVQNMLEEVNRKLGPIDVLVNNAGICYHTKALDVTVEEWQQVMDVNVNGLWYCCQTVGRQMVERRSGSIINIGSMSGLIVNRPQMQPHYNASKAAVHHITKSLAAEWAPFHVRVNAIAPGYIKTPMSPVDQPDLRQNWIEDAPMVRYGQPEELGPLAVYLASNASSFMTGSVIVIDGGYTLW
jgi:NAD(P)-dependent dehydrogenase (short-subunit alcohol dehydrogenase family)